LKPFLIITGMHRSGTSFLVRALNLYGVYLGELGTLESHDWKYAQENPRGHWENKKILDLTEKTLKFNNCSWHQIKKNIIINKEIGKEIRNVVNEFSKNNSLAAGIKDPRLILCLDSWSKYLPKDIVIVGIFRNPLKVAESLKIRDQFEYEKSLELWKTYNKKLIDILEKNNGFLLNFYIFIV